MAASARDWHAVADSGGFATEGRRECEGEEVARTLADSTARRDGTKCRVIDP